MFLVVITQSFLVNSPIDSESLCHSVISLEESIPLCDERGAQHLQEHASSSSSSPPHPSQLRWRLQSLSMQADGTEQLLEMCFSEHALPHIQPL